MLFNEHVFYIDVECDDDDVDGADDDDDDDKTLGI